MTNEQQIKLKSRGDRANLRCRISDISNYLNAGDPDHYPGI
jgi:hypothetical protein